MEILVFITSIQARQSFRIGVSLVASKTEVDVGMADRNQFSKQASIWVQTANKVCSRLNWVDPVFNIVSNGNVITLTRGAGGAAFGDGCSDSLVIMAIPRVGWVFR